MSPLENTIANRHNAEEFVYPKTDDIFPISRLPHYADDLIAPVQDGYYLVDSKGRALTNALPITICDHIHESLIAYQQHLDSKTPEYGKRGKLIGSILIPMNPVTKKNSQMIVKNNRGRPFVVPSATYTRALNDVRKMGSTIWIKQPETSLLPISIPVCVTCNYYRDSHRVVDITNLESSIMDTLVSIGVLEDDNCNIVICTDGSRVHYDKENARTEVNIYEWRFPK